MSATPYINREEDARHFYMLNSLHPDSSQALELRAFVAPNRDDFFRRSVSCNCPHNSRKELNMYLLNKFSRVSRSSGFKLTASLKRKKCTDPQKRLLMNFILQTICIALILIEVHPYLSIAQTDARKNPSFVRTSANPKYTLPRRNNSNMVVPVCRLLPLPEMKSVSNLSKNNSVVSGPKSINDLTSPTPPQNLRVLTESMRSIMASWDSASDPESGISGYVFGLGSASGVADIRWWQSAGSALNVGGISPYELGLAEGDTFYFSVYAVNGANLQSPIVSGGPVVLQWEHLGDINNEIGIAYSNGWSQSEKDSISMFLTRMIPIIKNIYGPPSHSYTVTLVKDSNYSSTNVFFPGTNEIHMLRMYPQLLTHELIHAFRDNVLLASDSLWRYNSTLSGFEESFAQGVSYVCMNKYVEEYPNGPIVTSSSIFGSFYDFDYDFQNTYLLTTTDFWSDDGGTGIYWLRYEMGAAAIHKIMMDYPNFPIAFNTLYYQQLNADHTLRVSRDLIKDLISTVAPSIEGSQAKDWIDKQHVFDCRVSTGHKIWVSTQHYDDWDQQYLIFQSIYYYETFSNGSEWAYWDTATSQYIYYSSNGSVGSGTLKDWNGSTIWQKNLTITPVDNPPVWYGVGSAVANMTTGSDNQPWPGGDINNFILNLHNFGLYWLQLTFGNTTTTVPRIIGDTLRGTKGVYGAILNSGKGQLYIDHENLPEEPPLTVSNGVFYGKRSWTSIANTNTGGTDSKPGRVFARYVAQGGNVYEDQRNIDLGSYAGNQLFLFDTKSMKLVASVASSSPWKMQIIASIGLYQDAQNYAGVDSSASDGYDETNDIPEPALSPGNFISLCFPHAEWNSSLGNNFASDIRLNTSLADTVKRWYFQVSSNVVNDTVSLTFINEWIPLQFGKYLTDLKTGKRVNLKTNSQYKYFNADTIRSFMLMIGDTTAPSLALISPNGSNIWRSGTTKNIMWSTSDRTGIDSVFVYLSSNGGNSYSLVKSLGPVQSTSWTVPSEYLNNTYSTKIVSRDSLANQSTVSSSNTFTVVGDSLATSNPAGWSLVSIPFIPNDSSVINIFGGTSCLWSYAQATGYTQPSKITSGNGYWLGLISPTLWHVKGTAIEADSIIQPLTLGYNIIGNNYVNPVTKGSMSFMKSGTEYSFTEAINAGLVVNAMYEYNSMGYVDADTLKAFCGSWIAPLQSGVQLVEKPTPSTIIPLNSKTIGVPQSAKSVKIASLYWDLSIKATNGSIADEIFSIGVEPSSSNGFDAQFDAPRPPRNPGSDYLELYTTHTGDNYPVFLGPKYAKDFRDSVGAVWIFTVESSKDSIVTLSWDRSKLSGLARKVILRDSSNGQSVDMSAMNTYSFSYVSPHIFTINGTTTNVDKNSASLPTVFALSQNYPNPFNPSTVINYQLPMSAVVTLKVYDVLGRKVATLVNARQNAGYYNATFNATNLSTGVYFYRLEAGAYHDTKKLLLLR